MTLLEAQEIIAASAPGPYYAEAYRGFESVYLPQLCAEVDKLPPGRVLEVGPGWGTMMLWLAARGWQVEVCDMIPLGHWIPRELLARANAAFHQRDIFMGPVAVEAFDLVLMTQVIPHLKFRPDEVIAICREMLKPGGVLVVTANDADTPKALADHGNDWQAVPQYGTAPACPSMVVCLYTRDSLEALLRTAFAQVHVWQEGTVHFGVCMKENV